MSVSCQDCWTRANNSIPRYRELLAGHAENQPVLEHGAVRVYLADCLALLRTMPDESVHAVVTDPPYGLADHKPAAVVTALTAWANGDRESVPDGHGFMGRKWDKFVPPPAVWDECLRVLKPGGHLLCFSGTRTVDLMGLSVRMAGFEIRDSITWHYGSGFPKSLDVSKAIDKAAGARREVVGIHRRHGGGSASSGSMSGDLGTESELPLTAPATDAARQWQGWGTALKPASEPIVVARKPLVGTVAANVQAHGCGGLNVDATRVRTAGETDEVAYKAKCASVVGLDSNRTGGTYGEWTGGRTDSAAAGGRWPANVVFTHSPDCTEQCADGCPVAELDAQTADLKGGVAVRRNLRGQEQNANGIYGSRGRDASDDLAYGDTGSASRFFPTFRYQAKAPASERPKIDGRGHPTVKPLALMRWLVRLVTPPGGTVLDPFAGSGTTGQATELEGFASVLIESDPDHIPLIVKRLTGADPVTAGEVSA